MALKVINKTLKTMWYLKGSQSSVFKNGVIWQNLLSKKTRWATSIHIAIILQFSRMKIQFANTSFIHIVPYTSKLHFSCQVNIIIAISFITIFSLLLEKFLLSWEQQYIIQHHNLKHQLVGISYISSHWTNKIVSFSWSIKGKITLI